MKLVSTLAHIVSTFCILALTALIVMLIWGLINQSVVVWKTLLSLAVIYFALLLMGGESKSSQNM